MTADNFIDEQEERSKEMLIRSSLGNITTNRALMIGGPHFSELRTKQDAMPVDVKLGCLFKPVNQVPILVACRADDGRVDYNPFRSNTDMYRSQRLSPFAMLNVSLPNPRRLYIGDSDM